MFRSVGHGDEQTDDLKAGGPFDLEATTSPEVVIGPEDLRLDEGTVAIVFAVGSEDQGTLNFMFQSIRGVQSAPRNVLTGDAGLATQPGPPVWAIAMVTLAIVGLAWGTLHDDAAPGPERAAAGLSLGERKVEAMRRPAGGRPPHRELDRARRDAGGGPGDQTGRRGRHASPASCWATRAPPGPSGVRRSHRSDRGAIANRRGRPDPGELGDPCRLPRTAPRTASHQDHDRDDRGSGPGRAGRGRGRYRRRRGARRRGHRRVVSVRADAGNRGLRRAPGTRRFADAGTRGLLPAPRAVPGDIVHVDFADGSRASFRVVARRSYPKSDLPANLFDRAGRSILVLVTCGGSFDEATGSYDDNVVVFAVPRT